MLMQHRPQLKKLINSPLILTVFLFSGIVLLVLPSERLPSIWAPNPQKSSTFNDDISGPHGLSLLKSWNLIALYRANVTDPALQFSWTAQVGQDRTIVDVFDGKKGGFFVDLAANDAVRLSNTLTLEKMFGWKGLCIEPNPGYMKGYLHRKCQLVQAVVGPVEDETVSFKFDSGALGGIVGEGFDNKEAGNAPMYTVSVGKILQDFSAPSLIDYLSLDIEGAEAWAFQTFPWDTYTFLTLTVERPKPELVEMLKQNGYIYLCNHGSFGDEFWVHPRVPNFQKVLENYQGKQECREGLS